MLKKLKTETPSGGGGNLTLSNGFCLVTWQDLVPAVADPPNSQHCRGEGANDCISIGSLAADARRVDAKNLNTCGTEGARIRGAPHKKCPLSFHNLPGVSRHETQKTALCMPLHILSLTHACHALASRPHRVRLASPAHTLLYILNLVCAAAQHHSTPCRR